MTGSGNSESSEGELSRLVLDYARTVEEIVSRAKDPGFNVSDWAPLERFVATGAFERVGPYRDRMDWQGYLAMMTRWAGTTGFETTIRRVTETGRLVFFDIEERQSKVDGLLIKNTLSVFEFDEAAKLTRLDVFQQCAV